LAAIAKPTAAPDFSVAIANAWFNTMIIEDLEPLTAGENGFLYFTLLDFELTARDANSSPNSWHPRVKKP
jgi:hypothetical protein